MGEYTIVSVKRTTKNRLMKFKDVWFDVKNDDELVNDMIDELEKRFSQEEE